MSNIDEMSFKFQVLVEDMKDELGLNKKMLVAATKDGKSGDMAYYQGRVDSLEELLDALGEII